MIVLQISILVKVSNKLKNLDLQLHDPEAHSIVNIKLVCMNEP